jgi:hypothetical protein
MEDIPELLDELSPVRNLKAALLAAVILVIRNLVFHLRQKSQRFSIAKRRQNRNQ